MERVHIVCIARLVRTSDYVNTGRPNPICFYGHFYDIKTFHANN